MIVNLRFAFIQVASLLASRKFSKDWFPYLQNGDIQFHVIIKHIEQEAAFKILDT